MKIKELKEAIKGLPDEMDVCGIYKDGSFCPIYVNTRIDEDAGELVFVVATYD